MQCESEIESQDLVIGPICDSAPESPVDEFYGYSVRSWRSFDAMSPTVHELWVSRAYVQHDTIIPPYRSW